MTHIVLEYLLLTLFMAVFSSVVAFLSCSRAESMKGVVFFSWATSIMTSALWMVASTDWLMDMYTSIRVWLTCNSRRI